MKTSLYTQEFIRQLDQEMPNYLSGLYLRGSIVRGEGGTGDVDLIVVGEQDDGLSVPTIFNGNIPINPTYKTTEQLDDIYRISPRSWEMLTDIVPIRQDGQVEMVIQKRREWLKSACLGLYISYLHTEHEWVMANPIPKSNEYDSHKTTAGSRRSIMRTIFTLKCLQPEAFDIVNTEMSIEYFQSKHMLPESYLEDYYSIMAMLKDIRANHATDEGEWQRVTQNLERVNSSIMREGNQEAESHLLDSELASSLQRARLDDLSHVDIGELIQSFSSYASHEEWLLLFSLAVNPSINDEQLSILSDRLVDSESYKDIHRAIVHHR